MSLVSAARALRCPLELPESAPGSAASSDAPAAGGDHGSGIGTQEPGWGPKREDQNQGEGIGTGELELGPGSRIVDTGAGMDSGERRQGPTRGPAAHPGDGTVASSDVAHLLCLTGSQRHARPGAGQRKPL